MERTLDILGKAMSSLESGGDGYSFCSGKAAFATILDLVESGAHIIASDNLNNNTYQIFESVRRRTSALTFSYVKDFKKETLEAVLQENTRLIWVESLIWPALNIPDFKTIIDFAKTHAVISVCDNTLATPYLLSPIQVGFDVVAYDAKGFLSGSLETDGGCAVVSGSQEFLKEKLQFLRNTLGSSLSAAEQTVTTKALESLEKRITRHCVSAKYIANFLLANRRVSAVHHLGLKSHPQFSYASESLRDFGGVLSLVLSGGIDAAMAFQEKLNLFSVSEIFGGSKSTMWHPASKTYSSVPSEIRSHLGAADGFFQFSIGLENVDNLTADLEQALAI